jgi:hypothetical protein
MEETYVESIYYEVFIQKIDKCQLDEKANEKSAGKPDKFGFPLIFAFESPGAVPYKTINQSDNVTHRIRDRKR